MNLFIDTNVILSFYHLSSDDLGELGKLIVLLKNKKATLFLPTQVINEFWRNRENKIATSLKDLRNCNFSPKFPNYCKSYSLYADLKEILKQANLKHSELVTSIEEDIQNQELGADSLINELFENSQIIEINDQIVDEAERRVAIGNPPLKKDGNLGDAINWIALLNHVPKKLDLHFLTQDSDYLSKLDQNNFNDFLLMEWTDLQSSKLIYYKRISKFFEANFPEIKIGSELEKTSLIEKLINSSNFTNTHLNINKLSGFEFFSPTEINQLLEAAINNSQIGWIIGDPVVTKFYADLIKGKEDQLDGELVAKILSYIGSRRSVLPENDDEIPF